MVVKDQMDANVQICYVDIWHTHVQTPKPSDAYREHKIENEDGEESFVTSHDPLDEHQPKEWTKQWSQPEQKHRHEIATGHPGQSNRPEQYQLSQQPGVEPIRAWREDPDAGYQRQ